MGNLFSNSHPQPVVGLPVPVPVATGTPLTTEATIAGSLPAEPPSDGKAIGDTKATGDTNPELDLLFLMDATGSMGSYIAAAKSNIEAISNRLAAAEGGMT